MSLITLALFAAFVSLNLFAGVESYRNRRRGYWVGLLNELLQVPSLAIPGFAYEYIGLGQVVVGVKINPSDFTFLVGFSADLLPGTFLLWLAGPSDGANIAVDVISAAFVIVLWRALYSPASTPETPLAHVQ
jgi:hypothetical protein